MRIDNVNRIITVLMATSQLEGLQAAPTVNREKAQEHVNTIQKRATTKADGEMITARSETSTERMLARAAYPSSNVLNKRSTTPKQKNMKRAALKKQSEKEKKTSKEESEESDFSTDSEYDSTDEEEGTHSGNGNGNQYWKPSKNSPYWKGDLTDEKKTNTKAEEDLCQTEEGQNKLPKGTCKEQEQADSIVGV